MAANLKNLSSIVSRIFEHGNPVVTSGEPSAQTDNRPGIVCIDGPAGSGKTTLASQIAPHLNAQIVHMDDLYNGWTGIEQGAQYLVDAILSPFSQGKEGEYQRFDWELNQYAEVHRVPPARLLVVEGCASATKLVDNFDPFIVWVEAADNTRLARGLERDGEHLREHWLRFMADEKAIYKRNQTAQRAHLRLDGFGNINYPATD